MNRTFNYPEQLAIAKAIALIPSAFEIVNFTFFDRIETELLRLIPPPDDAPFVYEHFRAHDFETRVNLYVRGEPVISVTVQGHASMRRPDAEPVLSWRVKSILGRDYFWRNDPEEKRDRRLYTLTYGYAAGAGPSPTEHELHQAIKDLINKG